MQITAAQIEHTADWIRLRQAVYSDCDLQLHEREIEIFRDDNSKKCYLAISDTSQVCGIVEVSLRNVVDGCLTSPVGYVEGIYVDLEFRRSGVSRLLLDQAEKWCRSKGCTEIATDAELDNEEAQRFHQHMGFEETCRVVEYRKSISKLPV